MSRHSRKERSPLWLFVLFVAGIIVFLIGLSFTQEVRRRVLVQQHINDLKKEIKDHEQKIADLNKLTEYLKTDSFIERSAHEKLNYKRPGERIVVVPEGGAVAGAEIQTNAGDNGEISIPRQWWNLFFAQS